MRFSQIIAGAFLFLFLSSAFAAPLALSTAPPKKRDLLGAVGGLVGGLVADVSALLDLHLYLDASVQIPGILGVNLNALIAGDIVVDGKIDLLGITALADITLGRNGAVSGCPLFTNNGTCFASPSIISAIVDGVVSLTDINLDGFLDVLISGVTVDGANALVLLQGNGLGAFVEVDLAGLLNLDIAIDAHVWGDLDLDGDLDLVICGTVGTTAVTKVFLNVDAQLHLFADLTGLFMGPTINLADINNDGFLDILLTGSLTLGVANPTTLCFMNQEGTAFLNVNLNIAGFINAAVSLGDINNDGWIDAVITGHTGVAAEAHVYLNNRGIFALLDVNLLGIVGDVVLADLNNDGFLDIALSGALHVGGLVTKVYINNQHLAFVDLGLGLQGLLNPTLLCLDVNLDGLLDLTISGQLALGTPTSLVYLNAAVGPLAINADITLGGPTHIFSEWLDNNTLKIYWPDVAAANSFNLALKAGVDIHVAAHVDLLGIDLNANVDVDIGAVAWIVSPLSVPALGGVRMVPAIGNCGGRTFSIITGLDSSLTYLFGVQSIGANYVGSPFTWGCTGPDCSSCQVCNH